MFLIYHLVSYTFLFLSLLAFFATLVTRLFFGDIWFEQIILHQHGAMAAGDDIILKYILFAFIPALLCLLLAMFFNIKKYLLWLCSVLLLAFCIWKLKIIEFVTNQLTYSEIYKQEYVAPDQLHFTFPEKKRNLIVLYLESMEENYADPSAVGDNLLPNLSQMPDALTFEGFHQLDTQDYTIAAQIAGLCGVPYKVTALKNSAELQSFLPELVCYPQILQKNGYRTYFMKGADLEFARTGIFLIQHGFADIAGQEELTAAYDLADNIYKGTSWGINDNTLYNLARRKLTQIAAQNEPFMFSMITLDTHGPDVYLDKLCTSLFEDDRDIILCADKMAAEFINWIRSQPFYENTTLVVIGDHPHTGGNPLYKKEKERKIVNLFFNYVDKPITTNRQWTTLDLPATILSSMGIKWENNAFGLGRSLFGDDMTLREIMGYGLDIELMKNAKEYNSFEKSSVSLTPDYTPYPEFNTIIKKADQIASYSEFSKNKNNMLWTDNLSFTLPETDATELKFDIWFNAYFNNGFTRKIDVYANGAKVASWNLSVKAKRPFGKRIRIPASVLTNDRKVLLEFRTDNAGHTTYAVGISVMGFRWAID